MNGGVWWGIGVIQSEFITVKKKKFLQAVKIKSRWHEIVAGATEGLKRKDWMHVSRPSFQVEILKIRRKSHKIWINGFFLLVFRQCLSTNKKNPLIQILCDFRLIFNISTWNEGLDTCIQSFRFRPSVAPATISCHLLLILTACRNFFFFTVINSDWITPIPHHTPPFILQITVVNCNSRTNILNCTNRKETWILSIH
jgi:hypothetical protein